MNENTDTRKPECLLFLSWQSDRKDCRNFVSSTVKKLPDRLSDLVTITVDRDTVNVPGSPDIGDTIFEKIDRCDLFLADLTLINDDDSGYRRTPNPNVMIELGYAIKTLGWERILLIQCEDYGDIEELPFDINHRRICNFSLGINEDNEEERSRKKQESKNNVIERIKETVKLLREQNKLFGGNKGKSPKFEMKFQRSAGIMQNIVFKVKNISSVMASALKVHDVTVMFEDGKVKSIECNPKAQFNDTSLAKGESTEVHLNNAMLGAGPGYNNYAWHNIVLKWQFSCEDEEGTEYWYEVSKYIDYVEKFDILEEWIIRYIG